MLYELFAIVLIIVIVPFACIFAIATMMLDISKGVFMLVKKVIEGLGKLSLTVIIFALGLSAVCFILYLILR